MRSVFSRSITEILRVLLPWGCAGCRCALEGVADQGFCGACWLSIQRIDGAVCQHCGLPLRFGGGRCFDCSPVPLPVLTRSAAVFAGSLRQGIHRFKYGGRPSISRPFGLLLERAWDQWPSLHHVQGLVPVPLHPKAERFRGYNQAALLAKALGDRIGRPVLDGLLVRRRRTPPQATLSKVDRRLNVRDVFEVVDSAQIRHRLRGLSLLLIDDVCTTGSTLTACARALRRAGVRDVAALTLARDL